MLDDLEKALKGVTKDWAAAKKRSDRNDRISQADWRRIRQVSYRVTIKDAAYAVMEQAYLKASANGALWANARQIMYAARPLVMARTDNGECWANSSYFTQHLLPDYMAEHPTLTAGWQVAYDARGHITEPHTGRTVDLGTLGVRGYLHSWLDDPIYRDPIRYFSARTSGPAHRYGAVLFAEKEGFDQLLRQARIARRFDIGIMSTKGMSVTAARELVEELSARGVTIFVARDFDKSGFSIVHTLGHTTRRYTFGHRPDVIDLGLRLDDVEAMGLDSEPVDYSDKSDPRSIMRRRGATDAECDFLVEDGSWGRGWSGKRVELNAMTSDQFIAWLEAKLTDHGVVKTVPDDDTLTTSYLEAFRYAEVRKRLDEIDTEIGERVDAVDIPDDLAAQVRARLDNDPTLAWDDAIADIAGADHVDRDLDDDEDDEDGS
jgi:Topoisomerase 6 subunit A/Spo11, Toprim domain